MLSFGSSLESCTDLGPTVRIRASVFVMKCSEREFIVVFSVYKRLH